MANATGQIVYDAVVVGAGPAGASAAETLARAGGRVLLLERARLPRYKPCGGALTARARAYAPAAAEFTPQATATSLDVIAGRHALSTATPHVIGMTMREHFDAYLTARAVAAGAEVRDGTALGALEVEGRNIKVGAGKDRVRTRYVIGADGANGVTARLAGFDSAAEPAAAIEAEVRVSDAVSARYAQVALLDFRAAPGGYGWIFGKGDHVSAGVCTVDTGARRGLRPALDAFLAAYPELAAGTVIVQRGHRVPLAGGRGTRWRGGVVLAGDAAALADPFTGEGISYALASGRRAGGAVLSALSDPGKEYAAMTAYDRYLSSELCGDLRYARLVAAVVYRYAQPAVRLARESGFVRDLALHTLNGSASYRDVLVAMATRLPQLARFALAGGLRGDSSMPS